MAKRADITPLMLCQAIADHGSGAFGVLATEFPAKVVIAAICRDTSRGYVSYGVTVGRPFLDTRGRRLLASTENPEAGRTTAGGTRGEVDRATAGEPGTPALGAHHGKAPSAAPDHALGGAGGPIPTADTPWVPGRPLRR